MNRIWILLVCVGFLLSSLANAGPVAILWAPPGINSDAWMDTAITSALVQHYRQGFQGAIREDVEMSDSILSITFVKRMENEVEDKVLLVVNIPRLKDNFITGDLEKDGENEIMACVGVEGGGRRGSYDLFVFKQHGGKYTIASTIKSPDVCGCNGSGVSGGYFYPDSIENSQVVGRSICWSENDAPCCPTMRFETRLKFVSGKLILVSKKAINKKQDSDGQE